MKYNNKVVVFDIDGTLYDTRAMDKQNITASIASISEYLNIEKKEASILLKEKRKIQNSEEMQSISNVLNSLFIPKDIIEKNQYKYIKPESFIDRDEQLVKLIRQIRLKYKVAILTNIRSHIANRILICLGFILNDFDLIVTGDKLSEAKPSVFELKKCIKKLNGSYKESIMIGDRWYVDLQPATMLGMRTLLIKNKNEVIEWLEKELKTGPNNVQM